MIHHNKPYISLRAALDNQTVPDLKKLAVLLETGTKSPIKKDALVEWLHGYIRDKLESIWKQLTELGQAAVAEMVHNFDEYFDTQRFVAKYGKTAEDKHLALLFFNNAIPNDLRKNLARFVPKPAEAELKISGELSDVWEVDTYRWENGRKVRGSELIKLEQRHGEALAIQELHVMLRLIDDGKISVSDKTFQATAASLKTIAEALPQGDFYANPLAEDMRYGESIGFIKAFAWPLLLQTGGLAERNGKKLQLSSAGQKALGDAPETTFSKLWKSWLKYTGFDELRRIDTIKGQNGKGKRSLTAVAGRRKAIVEALGQCPVQHWIEVDEFFRQMRATGNSFEVTRNPWELYISDANYGNLGYDGSHDWNILQGRYARCFLFEYAATLGLLDAAYIEPKDAPADFRDLWGTDDMGFLSRYDGLMVIRLTPLGAYCLGISKTYQPGEDAQKILRLLTTVKKQVGKLLDKGVMRLFECSNPHMAVSIATEKSLEKLCTLMENRYLLVPETQLDKFRAALLKLGYHI